MAPIDINAIEQRARRLRAEEMQRLQNLFAERLSLYLVLLGRSILALFEGVHGVAGRKPHRALLTRLNRFARGLFAWYPRGHHHHHC